MKFTTARLCGGKALMAVSSDELDIDMEAAVPKMVAMGHTIMQADDMMVVSQWNGMDVTTYRQGKVMYFPLEDRHACIAYATELLEALQR